MKRKYHAMIWAGAIIFAALVSNASGLSDAAGLTIVLGLTGAAWASLNRGRGCNRKCLP